MTYYNLDIKKHLKSDNSNLLLKYGLFITGIKNKRKNIIRIGNQGRINYNRFLTSNAMLGCGSRKKNLNAAVFP